MGGAFGPVAKCDLPCAANNGVPPFQMRSWEFCIRKSSPGEYRSHAFDQHKEVVMTLSGYSARGSCDVGFVTWALPKDDLDTYVADLPTKL